MREDHIRSAIVFLKEPGVASAALTKKVEFLESKGLTSEEINEALRQAESSNTGAGSSGSSTSTGTSSSSGSSSTGTTSTGVLSAAAIPPRPSYMTQQPPPIPKRDWKDYFVMATVSAGLAYGLYECTRRYVLPMIMPPTPPALEADREAVEEEFRRTEALLRQVQEDTESLKQQEEARTATFEAVMEEARKVITQFKQHVDDHKHASKLALSNIETLRDSVPRSLQQHSEAQAKVVDQLKTEIESLKALVGRRSGAPSVPPASAVPSMLPFRRDEKKAAAGAVDAKPDVKPDPNTDAKTDSHADAKTDATADQKPFVPIPEWQRAAKQQQQQQQQQQQ